MGVMAAPNRSVITARVEDLERVPGQPKWYFAVTVIAAESIEGGLFVRAGDPARVFVVADDPGLAPGEEFRAEVEYVGGPGGGELQLLRLLWKDSTGEVVDPVDPPAEPWQD